MDFFATKYTVQLFVLIGDHVLLCVWSDSGKHLTEYTIRKSFIASQMAERSALSTGRTLFPRNIVIFVSGVHFC
jgi:hypothetical protein